MTEKNSKEDAGIDEGYGEPKEKVQSGWSGLEEAVLLPTSQWKKVWLFVAYSLPLHTGVIISLCQIVSAALNLISYGLHFPGGTKASRRDASRG